MSLRLESPSRPFEAPFAPAGFTQSPLRPVPPIPERPLFELRQLEVDWEEPSGTLWTHMRFRGRPSYNPDKLIDFRAWQAGIEHMFAGRQCDLATWCSGRDFPAC